MLKSFHFFLFQNSAFFQKYDVDLREGILGDGSFSVCRRCVCRSTGAQFAVKIVSKRVDCSNEIALLRQCQGHPNIVQLQEVLQVCCVAFSNNPTVTHFVFLVRVSCLTNQSVINIDKLCCFYFMSHSVLPFFFCKQGVFHPILYQAI